MTYPTTLDELTDGVPSDVAAPTTELDDATYPHDDHHRALAVAVEAIETELGTDPSGSEATVKDRIAATETVANAAATAAALAAEATLARNADNLTSGTVAEARIAATIARDSEVSAAITTSESGQVRDGDAAGGVLSGTYPNPGFASDMATQAELDAEAALARNGDNITSGTVADARIASSIARDSEVAAAYQPLDADLTDIAAIADAQGDIIVRGASGWERLAKSATSTHVLTAGASQPSWTAPSGGGDPTPRRLGLFSSSVYSSPTTVNVIDQNAQAVGTAQIAWWWPAYAHRTMTIAGFATYCWTLEAGSTMRFGIYANTGDDLAVGSLTADYGTVSGASTGAKTLAGSTSISAGFFWICNWCSNHSTVRWNRRTTNPDFSPFGGAIAGGATGIAYSASAVDYSAGLPASPPALTAVYTNTAVTGASGAYPYWRYT